MLFLSEIGFDLGWLPVLLAASQDEVLQALILV